MALFCIVSLSIVLIVLAESYRRNNRTGGLKLGLIGELPLGLIGDVYGTYSKKIGTIQTKPNRLKSPYFQAF